MVQAWLDNGGLYQKYGVDQTTSGTGGEYRNNSHEREIEFTINLANLTEAETVLDDNVFMPAGMRISEVKVRTVTAAATGVSIDLGLVRTDRTTEIDYNGLLTAFLTASMDAANETTTMTIPATNLGGALVGTTTANVGHFTCSRTTATAFTAGVIIVTIKYYRP